MVWAQPGSVEGVVDGVSAGAAGAPSLFLAGAGPWQLPWSSPGVGTPRPSRWDPHHRRRPRIGRRAPLEKHTLRIAGDRYQQPPRRLRHNDDGHSVPPADHRRRRSTARAGTDRRSRGQPDSRGGELRDSDDPPRKTRQSTHPHVHRTLPGPTRAQNMLDYPSPGEDCPAAAPVRGSTWPVSVPVASTSTGVPIREPRAQTPGPTARRYRVVKRPRLVPRPCGRKRRPA